MTAYDSSEWTNLFIATAGAAALTGLVFVAVSINLKEIVRLEGHRSWVISRVGVASLGTVPFVIGAISVIAIGGGGP